MIGTQSHGAMVGKVLDRLRKKSMFSREHWRHEIRLPSHAAATCAPGTQKPRLCPSLAESETRLARSYG